METKTIENGNIKVWHDHEEEFIIVGKNEPLIDTLIDANLLQRKYSKMLVEEVRIAGLDSIHGVFIELDETLQSQLDKLDISELDLIFNEFNSIFQSNLKYHKNSNGLISIVFPEFKDYQEFLQNYFGSFLLKMFAFKVDIIATEVKNDSIKGLSGFISKFADNYLKIYLETSKSMKFKGIIRVK
jgi:hypothetical protein